MLSAGVPAGSRQCRPYLHPGGQVQFEQSFRCASHCCQGADLATINPEMVVPTIGARVEKTYEAATQRVQGGDVGTLETIAVEAGQSEVLRRGRSTVLFRDNVVRFVREERVFFGKQAILATVLCTSANTLAQAGGNVGGGHAWDSV